MDLPEDSTRDPTRRTQRRRHELLDAVRGYVCGPLARRLGALGRAARVEPAEHGRRSLVYFVEVDGARPVVFRAVRRFSDARTLAYNHRALRAMSLPVPELLAADLSLLTRLRWGFWPVVEERVEGSHLDEIGRPEGAVRAVAATLACFHNVQRPRWGWPAVSRWGSYRRHLLARMKRRSSNLDAALAQPRSGELVQWCREQARTAPLDAPFSLTHSRIYCTNFIVTPDHRAYAIDLLECRFGTFGIDLTWALKRLCAEGPAACGWFLDTYFGHRPEPCREAYERSRPFFEVDYHLARASIYSRRLPRRRHVPQAAEQKLAALRRHTGRLAAITGIELIVKGSS